ncbi:tryptophan--tRNA ligase [Halobium salinum]|uniref:Tryptophan--tRNA ligase n=1 Tax=Halobium salinum TaxID=1364940 RepID=A0ABD5P7X0_9EURY|nr:tryptophan--tRNA ligase [Halobium salinum]
MQNHDDTTTAPPEHTENAATDPTDDFTVTPYDIEGEVDYNRLLDRFGADRLTPEQVARFSAPPHRLLRRERIFAGRDVDRFLDAAAAGEEVSVVTGIGPSGPMHVGHLSQFYFAKHLQDEFGARVYIPLSDDEKHLLKDLTLDETATHLRDNLRDLLAVGFDPELTRIVVDTADADALYPTAVRLAKGLTPATVEAVYGDPANVGVGFYPAMQATHLLLPQLVHGAHPTAVPVAVDQDPHVRVCRDLAAKARFDVEKPGALLSKFLPRLGGGGGKMSSSEDVPGILLSDDRETVHEKVQRHAFSGGQDDLEAHRELGGNPEVDVAYQLLYAFFETDDAVLERLAREYRAGDLLSGELKTYAADRISDFLEAHRERRPADGRDELREAVASYRLREDERRRLRHDPLS